MIPEGESSVGEAQLQGLSWAQRDLQLQTQTQENKLEIKRAVNSKPTALSGAPPTARLPFLKVP